MTLSIRVHASRPTDPMRRLLTHLEALHGSEELPPPLNNVFVVSESSGRYRLDRRQLGEMVATFVAQAIRGALGASVAFERAAQRSSDPYATFVCASAEFDEERALGYCATRTAIDLLNWIRRTSKGYGTMDGQVMW